MVSGDIVLGIIELKSLLNVTVSSQLKVQEGILSIYADYGGCLALLYIQLNYYKLVV